MQKRSFASVFGFIVPVLVATMLWGTAFPGVKLAFRAFGIDAGNLFQQLFFAGSRFLPAGILTLAYHGLRGNRVLPERGMWGRIALVGLVQVVLYYTPYFYGLAHTTSVRGTIINSTGTFFAIGIAYLLRMEKPTLRRVSGCVIGFAGVLLMQIGSFFAGQAFTLAGEGMMLLAAAFDGSAKILSKRVTRSIDPTLVNGWQLVLGGGVLLAAGAAGGGSFPVESASGYGWLAYLTVLSAVAYTLWMRLLSRYDVTNVVVCSFLTPVFGTLATALLIPGENALNWQNLLVLCLISCGVIIVNTKGKAGK